jgi:hypothetical protein
MSDIDGTLSSFQGIKPNRHPNELSASTASLVQTEQAVTGGATWHFGGLAANTWHPIINYSIAVPAGPSFIGYNVSMHAQTSGSTVCFAVVGIIDPDGIEVTGANSFCPARQLAGTSSGGGYHTGTAYVLVNPTEPTEYRLAARHSTQVNVASISGSSVFGNMTQPNFDNAFRALSLSLA